MANNKENLNENINENINENETDSMNNNTIENSKKELLEIEARIDAKLKLLDQKSEEIAEQTEKISKQAEEVEKKLPEITNEMLIKSALSVKEQLDNMPKRTVRIPMDEKNPKEVSVPVTISGYTYQIKRGESVEVPEEVERILIEAKYI